MEWNKPEVEMINIEETASGDFNLYAEGTVRESDGVQYYDYDHGYTQKS